jgi:heme A synthase
MSRARCVVRGLDRGGAIGQFVIASLAAIVMVVAGVWVARHKPKQSGALTRTLGPTWAPVAQGVAIAALFLGAPVAFLYAPWAAMTIRCGHQPVSTTNFAAASSYSLPGDTFYDRVWILGDGYVCSEADAVKKGFHRSG